MPIHCPICRREFEPTESPTMPFCSERCRLVDLGRWLGETYRVPVESDDPDEEPEEPASA
ncbi:MAG: DNA gyrase inhibitor YacG [Planctomycetaceae bacterium]|nr:DNA gyrase inhibitor YacG [Planctomycetaceae bacterium]